LKKKITAKSNKSKKEEKKEPESKNLFDFFDLAVKILPKVGSFQNIKVNADALVMVLSRKCARIRPRV
jgi:hypothetical protein